MKSSRLLAFASVSLVVLDIQKEQISGEHSTYLDKRKPIIAIKSHSTNSKGGSKIIGSSVYDARGPRLY